VEEIPFVLERRKAREERREKHKAQGEKNTAGNRITWTEDTVDNEFMNKKSSKRCCIYHKPKAFDESSTESDGGPSRQ